MNWKNCRVPLLSVEGYDRQGEHGDICPVDLLYPKFDNCLHIVIAVEDDVLGDTVGIQPEPWTVGVEAFDLAQTVSCPYEVSQAQRRVGIESAYAMMASAFSSFDHVVVGVGLVLLASHITFQNVCCQSLVSSSTTSSLNSSVSTTSSLSLSLSMVTVAMFEISLSGALIVPAPCAAVKVNFFCFFIFLMNLPRTLRILYQFDFQIFMWFYQTRILKPHIIPSPTK